MHRNLTAILESTAYAFILIVTLLLSAVSNASEVSDSYQVEILLFKNDTNTSQPERTEIQKPTKLSKALQLQNYDGQTPMPAFTLLPRKRLKLKNEEYALKKRSQYRVLLHIAWLQDIKAPRESQSIHLYAQALGDPHSIYTLPPYNGAFPWTVNGLIKISQSNYINLSTDLIFDLGLMEEGSEGTTPMLYSMKQKRRLRPTEVHYIDHPNVGMLIAVYPVKAPHTAKKTDSQ